MEQERPRSDLSINSRNDLRKALHLELLYKENKVRALCFERVASCSGTAFGNVKALMGSAKPSEMDGRRLATPAGREKETQPRAHKSQVCVGFSSLGLRAAHVDTWRMRSHEVHFEPEPVIVIPSAPSSSFMRLSLIRLYLRIEHSVILKISIPMLIWAAHILELE